MGGKSLPKVSFPKLVSLAAQLIQNKQQNTEMYV